MNHPLNKKQEKPACPSCDSKKTYFKDKFWMCKNCLYQFTPERDLHKYNDYYQKDIGLEVQNILEEKPHLRKYAHIALSDLSRKKKKLRLMDIGCGTGSFLTKCKEQGYQAYGYDISKSQTTIAREINKLKHVQYARNIPEYARKVKIPKRFFDVITCFEVIEHIPDVNTFLKNINNYLKDDGIFILSTPNNDRLQLREVWDYPPIHVSRFKKSNIEMLLRKNGFSISKFKTFNELGYYSGNYIAKLSLSKNVLQTMVNRSQGQSNSAQANKQLFQFLSFAKNILCKTLDMPLYLALFFLPERGHTMYIVAQKIS